MNIPLPKSPLYCPNLTCFVYDQIFKGWNQPLVGTFVLDLGRLMGDLREERKRETSKMYEVLDKLKKILDDPEHKIPSYGGQGKSKV